LSLTSKKIKYTLNQHHHKTCTKSTVRHPCGPQFPVVLFSATATCKFGGCRLLYVLSSVLFPSSSSIFKIEPPATSVNVHVHTDHRTKDRGQRAGDMLAGMWACEHAGMWSVEYRACGMWASGLSEACDLRPGLGAHFHLQFQRQCPPMPMSMLNGTNPFPMPMPVRLQCMSITSL
jgi:hypothetical protein